MWRRFRSKQAAQTPRQDHLDERVNSTSESKNHASSILTSWESSLHIRRWSPVVGELCKDDGPSITPRRTSQLSETKNQILSLTSPEHQRRRPQDRRDDPIGLTVLHAPESKHRTVDILFIHGLGGTSLRTWCKNRDLEFLWPKNWLPEESDLSTARILTFGYNANFAAKKEQASLSINDFANDLLFHMKYDNDGDDKMGEVPIIIVAHSMGGLVFKKAFVHGHLDEQYHKITSSIKAVLFMATPHRGTDLAESLNRILTSSIFGHSPKDYVRELTKGSTTLDELNDTFRHHAAKLQIFSFYETLSTAVGPMNLMILEKHSSLLGYHNETPKPLMANHHDVVKFSSRNDLNYKSVRGALRSIANEFRFSKTPENSTEKDLEMIQKWLGVTGPPEEDLALHRSVRKTGTCEHLLHKPKFEGWLDSGIPNILWSHAPPGSGKSIQCSFVIESLQLRQERCAYWFFKDDDVQKRSLSNMLLSVAYQIAVEDKSFRRVLMDVVKSGMRVDKADAWTIWRNIFASRLSAISTVLYWVIDGLDESESSRTFIDLISNISTSQSNIRVLFFSRPQSAINRSIQIARRRVNIADVALTDNLKDIRLVAADEMEYFLPSDEFQNFKHEIIEEITCRSQGNFLWASLILKLVVKCHRQDEAKQVLRVTPDGMDKLYYGMAEAIAKVDGVKNTTLCKILLSWAIYSIRPIGIEELMEPYATELHTVIDLKHTISEICGQFVVINANNQVVLIHQTARQYLRACTRFSFSLDAYEVNEELLFQCLTFLCDKSLRTKIRLRKTPRFVTYASVSWALHLNRSSVNSDRILKILVKFFSGNFPLPWVQFLAINGHLSHLVAVSSHLMSFVRQRRKVDAIKPPSPLRSSELVLLETWALDLLKMTAKFGSHLNDDPDAIYKYIPAFSPESSVLYQKYASKPLSTISISGITNTDWDDCLARVSNGSDSALYIAVSAEYLALANGRPNGRIRLWSNTIFQEHSGFNPGEPISSVSFSDSGSLLACYCLDNTYVWRLSDRSVVTKIQSPYQERPKSLRFAQDESFLIVATDFRRVYRLNLDNSTPTWISYGPSLLLETSVPEGAFVNTPSSVNFNPDCTQLAVAYRNFPLAVWNIDPPEVIARCRQKETQGQTTNATSWTGVNCVVWHPFSGQVIGINRDGNIFKWGPIDDSYVEVKEESDNTPSDIQCCPNGLVFATSDVRGSVRIYDYSQMVQMYKLTSDSIVTNITFSPDSRRLYDLRGSWCNVWEPNCLIRINDTSMDPSEESESVKSYEQKRKDSWGLELDDKSGSMISLPTSEAYADTKPPITAVANCAKNRNIFAHATEDGTIEICDMESKRKHLITEFTFGMEIVHFALAQNGNYVAYCLLDGHVTVRSIDSSKPERISTQTVFAETKSISRGQIRQILFDSKSERLLVCGTERLQVLSVTDSSIAAEMEIDPADLPAQWENHPTNPNILLGFTADGVNALSWDALDFKYSLSYNLSIDSSDSQLTPSLRLEALSQSYHPKMHLTTTSENTASGRRFRFLLLDTSVLYEDQTNSTSSGSISAVHIPLPIAECIEQPVGILADGRLVFLDKALWVCTAQLWLPSARESGTTVTRHFFIPRDWLNSAGLVLCKVQADGTFLCPSKGEMAVITSNMGTDW
ncbi:Eisosome protein 1 [Penicillium coprophilum]|uniref:Eisosome protein 1 n=1 Tax=Penicillium coprophilum TaxID=36646 RepID=UPI00239AF9B7|nr:Eisosome protein 1 [Penicillium coprophilum]KAJ5162891.1 Eisosome protein 1 [Penicillium coprophilum]